MTTEHTPDHVRAGWLTYFEGKKVKTQEGLKT